MITNYVRSIEKNKKITILKNQSNITKNLKKKFIIKGFPIIKLKCYTKNNLVYSL